MSIKRLLSLPVDVARAITADAPGSNAAAVKKRGAQVAEKDASQALWLPRPISSRVSSDDTMDRGPFKSVPTRIRKAPSNRPKT